MGPGIVFKTVGNKLKLERMSAKRKWLFINDKSNHRKERPVNFYTFRHGSKATDTKKRPVFYPSVRRAHHSHSLSLSVLMSVSCRLQEILLFPQHNQGWY